MRDDNTALAAVFPRARQFQGPRPEKVSRSQRRSAYPGASVWTRWDTLGTVRASGLALFALGLGLALTAATDEGNVAWGERIGRTLPLIPVCAAIGVWGARAGHIARRDGGARGARPNAGAGGGRRCRGRRWRRGHCGAGDDRHAGAERRRLLPDGDAHGVVGLARRHVRRHRARCASRRGRRARTHRGLRGDSRTLALGTRARASGCRSIDGARGHRAGVARGRCVARSSSEPKAPARPSSQPVRIPGPPGSDRGFDDRALSSRGCSARPRHGGGLAPDRLARGSDSTFCPPGGLSPQASKARRSALGRPLGAALAIHGVLKAAAQPLSPLHSLGLERRREPFVTLSYVPDCAV